MTSSRLGQVTLEPDGQVVAGSVGQWTFIYTVGSYGIDEGGTIKISQRFASDWEEPQFTCPENPGYTTVWTNGDAKLSMYYSKKASERPWMKCLVIDIFDGSLKPGEVIKIIMGDQRYGCPGIRAQTFQEAEHEFRFFIDPTNACVTEFLPSSPKIQIVHGEIHSLNCIIPTQTATNQIVEIYIAGVDYYGNPTPSPEKLSCSWLGSGEVVFNQSTLLFTRTGSGYVKVEAGDMNCISNPITAYESLPDLRKYWGDLHAQTESTVGTGTLDEYFQFARDKALLDFCSHQGNDFQVTDDMWKDLNATIGKYHQDNHFVIFPGYEWSGNTAAGGDRNVFYKSEGFPIMRSSHWQVKYIPEDSLTPAHPLTTLFKHMHQAVGPDNVIIGAHVGGRYADLQHFFDQSLCHLVEVCSCWGIFEWLLWDAYTAGHIVGVMCNSDGHKGRPGAEYPGAGDFGISNGLTCVLTSELTRLGVFDALRNRRCYGTTGPRIDLNFEMDGFPMGSCVPWQEKGLITGSASGTASIEALQLFCGNEVIHEARPDAFSQLLSSNRIRVSWGGARIRGRAKRVVWDGEITLSGTEIAEISTFAIDAPTDGILEWDADHIKFRSSTMGDRDGIDLWLTHTGVGELFFKTGFCEFEVNLEELHKNQGKYYRSLGELDMHVCVEFYPEKLDEMFISFDKEVFPLENQRTPYMIKLIQSDGHMAWSSPIYVEKQC
jgi:hypothetical protein